MAKEAQVETPAETPAPTPVEDTPPQESDFDINGLLADDYESVSPETETEAKVEPDSTEAPVQASEEAQTEETPADAATPAPEEAESSAPEEVKAEEEAPKDETPAQEEEVEPPTTVQDLLDSFENKESEIVDALAQARYSLSQEDIDLLETDASAAVPKLLAKAHLQAVGASLKYMQALVPSMVQQQTMAMNTAREAETAFFDAFPALREHRAEALKAAQTYRSVYPKASRDEMIQNVGAVVMQKLGLSAQPPVAQNTPPAPKPSQPPHRPAGAVGSPVTAAPPQANPWAGLWTDFE